MVAYHGPRVVQLGIARQASLWVGHELVARTSITSEEARSECHTPVPYASANAVASGAHVSEPLKHRIETPDEHEVQAWSDRSIRVQCFGSDSPYSLETVVTYGAPTDISVGVRHQWEHHCCDL